MREIQANQQIDFEIKQTRFSIHTYNLVSRTHDLVTLPRTYTYDLISDTYDYI